MSYTLVYDPSKASRGAARMAFISIDLLGMGEGAATGQNYDYFSFCPVHSHPFFSFLLLLCGL